MGAKKKADCTPEEWAAYLKRQRENNKTSYHKNKEKLRERINAKNRERWANDPEFRQRRLTARKNYVPTPEALAKKRKQDNQRSRLKLAGLRPETFEVLLTLQGNCCAVCGRSFTKTPQADHCHDTGQPRGLLCATCNSVEGKIKATGLTPAEFATRLQAYLDNPPARTAELAA